MASANPIADDRPCLADKELSSSFWVTGDCCGLACAFVTNLLHFFAYYVQMKLVIGPSYGMASWIGISYTCLMVLAVVSHNVCRFTNPGTVPKHLRAPASVGKSDFVCHRSRVIKPPTSHYCRVARRVVLKMDHYCPWVNNVVGFFTQKYFLLFLLYTFLCCVFSGVSLGARAWSCSSRPRSPRRDTFCNPPPVDVVLSVINFVEAILFVLFTGCMFADQFEAISTNMAYIDRLKKKQSGSGRRGIYANMKDVFGAPFGVGWFLPLPPTKSLRREFDRICYATYDRVMEEARVTEARPTEETKRDGPEIIPVAQGRPEKTSSSSDAKPGDYGSVGGGGEMERNPTK